MSVRRVIVLLLTTVMVALVHAVPVMADHCQKWDRNCLHTDGDQGAGAVVTDGVQFPGVDANSTLGRATAEHANCDGCEWTISPACVANSPTETAMCQEAVASCTPPDVRYRVFFRPNATSPWQLIETVCLGPGERPTSVADIGEEVRERVVNYLPDAAPSFQPRQGGIVNLPTIFDAGEPRTIRTRPFDVLGFDVVVEATARWEWTFDRGVTRSFTEPGGAYPDQSVSWTYTTTGGRHVSVTTFWRATFTVDGDGPYAVPGPEISKAAGPLDVPVRAARAVLVGG
jgi:hypothetical protein